MQDHLAQHAFRDETMFNTILVANRGEIAIRIMRACRELGTKSIAVYSEADQESLHVGYADESYCIGPAQPTQSYLNIDKMLEIAQLSGSEAIHPGYGFLAQIPAFAQACEANNIAFIGPSSTVLRTMGDKVMARKAMKDVGIPAIPGSTKPVEDEHDIEELAETLGYPILIKAVFGGGGKGLRVVNSDADVAKAMELVRLEAETSFGSSKIYVEKLLAKPRHIEFQLLADKNGNVIQLGERECSIQRRYQKLIEETPSPMMTEDLRARMAEASIRAAETIEYTSAGTIEYLVDSKGDFYFLEMNTRLQVEHLITELVTGVDLVKEQIGVAAEEELRYSQDEIVERGHALNCRINSEDPYSDFAPCPGTITKYRPPGGPGVRVDAALYSGYTIPIFYDSLIAKLAVWGATRDEAILRMKNALGEYAIEGVETTIPYHLRILEDEHFRRGRIHTEFVHERIGNLAIEKRVQDEEVAALSVALAAQLLNKRENLAVIPRRKAEGASAWKMAGQREWMRSRVERA